MKKSFSYILLIAALILQLQQCKKDAPVTNTPNPNPQPTPCDTCLPAITTTGQNTFGCKINGKLWLPKAGFTTPAVRFDLFGKQIGIIAENSQSKDIISIYYNAIYDTCFYTFPNKTLVKAQAYYADDAGTKYYFADTIQKGYIHFLRVDFTNGIFSGTFEFDAYDIYHKNNGDTIHVTDGRFDVRP